MTVEFCAAYQVGQACARKWLPLACVALIVSFAKPSHAQSAEQSQPASQELQVRLGASVQKKLHKVLTLAMNAELRTDNWNPDRYLLGLEGRYKPIDYFALEAAWRSDLEERGRRIDHGHRPGLALLGYIPFDDFELGARVFYTFDFGRIRESRHRLRYRLKLQYDVPHVRLDLEVHAEAFHQLDDRGWFKMRYGVEGSYKFYKSKCFDQFIRLAYMLDYYLDQPRNVHIPELSYRLKF